MDERCRVRPRRRSIFTGAGLVVRTLFGAGNQWYILVTYNLPQKLEREQEVGFRVVYKGRSAASRIAMSALLLGLFVHAFLVSSTHAHRVERAGGAIQSRQLSAGRNTEAERPADAGMHAQCLLCRLQRNFVSDLPDSRPFVISLQPGPLSCNVPQVTTHSTNAFLVPAGRAPPLT